MMTRDEAEADEIASVFESVAVARLRPGDVVLFRSSERLHAEGRARVVEILEAVFPDNESIVLEGGQDIAVLRPERGFLRRLFGRT